MQESMHGYHGCYLRIDVSRRCAQREPIPEVVRRQYVGGSGLATWILLRETQHLRDYDPLCADAPIIFAFSPLVGSPLTTSAKFAVISKSPLTNRLNDSLSSSGFAIAGKRTGHDAIVLTGMSDEWITISIVEDNVVFDDATALRGQSAADAASRLKTLFPADHRVAAIGPAAEAGVLYATISHDGRHAGRGGSGTVMASKKVKAIIVGGNRRTSFAAPEQLSTYARDLSGRSLSEATAKYRDIGTIANLTTFNRLQTLPTRNFQESSFGGAAALMPPPPETDQRRMRKSCAACTIGCEHLFLVPQTIGDNASELRQDVHVRLEYETLFALGPMCGISDQSTVLHAAARCDALGIDTISTGGTIAFAMECVEKNLLTEAIADEPVEWLHFGSNEALLRAIDLIGSRSTGLGRLLSKGSRRAAEVIGGAATGLAPHVKGLEIPGYDPRRLQMMALGFAVGARGADHNRSGAYEVDFSEHVDRTAVTEADVFRAIETENESALMDSLILCRFLRRALQDRVTEMATMLRLVSGIDPDDHELIATAERIVLARRLFNQWQGWQQDEDCLPDRMLANSPDTNADSSGELTADHLNRLVREYYRQRHLNEDGTLTTTQTDRLMADITASTADR